MKLRYKFTLYISFLLLLVICGVSYTIYVAQKNLLTQQLSVMRTQTLRSFVSICTQSVKLNNNQQINDSINLLINTYKPSVVYAGFVDKNNEKIYISRDQNKNIDSEFMRRIVKTNIDFTEKYMSYSGEEIFEAATPIIVNGNNKGTFIIGFSQSQMNKQINDGISKMTHQIKIVSIIAIILAIILANFLGYTFAKPLRMLNAAAGAISNGNLDVEVNFKSRDEIGTLFTTFNKMAKQIKELDSMKDSFVSSVSHELRSPLSAIDGYCDLLIDGIEKNFSQEQQLKGLRIIKQATIRLTSFINNILDLAKIKANKLEIKKKTTDIKDVVAEIVTLYKPLSLQQKKTIDYIATEEIPKVLIDADKIKQVITNLVSNAMKFTKENGKILIKLLPNSPGYGNEYIEVWVQDDGIGIPKEQVDLVFEKFYQVQEGEFKRPKGTGLGLTIVFEMVKLHNGYVWAESDIGKGTTFKFTLPK